MNWVIRLLMVLVVASVAALVYVLVTDPRTQRNVTERVEAMRESITRAPDAGSPGTGVDRTPVGSPAVRLPAGESATPPDATQEQAEPPLDERTVPTVPSEPYVTASRGVVVGPGDDPTPGRTPVAHYLPGSLPNWSDFAIDVTTPVALLAGGIVSTEIDFAGPDGLVTSNFERLVVGDAAPGANGRVLDTAPYLALIGRVCTDERCSEPFVVGSNTVICPADLEMAGNLQLWTNNYVRVDGSQTRSTYSTTSGGYSFYVESASPADCGGRSAAPGVDAAVLASGRELVRPEFRVSSSQTFWRPFFLPLDRPLLIRATGQIAPNARMRSVSPDGTDRPADTDDLVLLVPGVPYASLIGRLCGAEQCGEPFLVGRERVICPSGADARHLELWINHLAPEPGLLDRAMPLTYETFELQTRSGEFEFTVAAAAADACGGQR